MTFPHEYQSKKQNLRDKDYSLNNDNNKINKNKNENNSLDQPITTIGEAVKEAVETGEEVVVAGPQTAGELTGTIENKPTENIQNTSKNKLTNLQTNENDTLSDNSKLELNLTKSPNDQTSMAKEEKIILNPKESYNSDEATIKTITTISTEGVNVEAATDMTIPVINKEEDIKAETDVDVSSMASTKNSQPFLESKDVEKPNSSINKETSQFNLKDKPKYDSDIKKSTISQESEKKDFQNLMPSEKKSKDVDMYNLFAMYTTFWQNFISNWYNTYNEFINNFMKMNSFWFKKS
ncbi:MAG TPA: hypothetical protein VFK40_13820 [Nitrososphaeraceae archaeon]|nr:hypothetical protein [Nitrososphaeraceae archaeon]